MNAEQVIKEHVGLIRKLARSFYTQNNIYSIEDLEQVAYMAVVKGMPKYKPESSAITTFITLIVRNDILKFIKKQKIYKDITPAAKPIEKDEDPNYIDFSIGGNVEDDVLRLKIAGYTYKEIAKKLSIPHRKVMRIVKNIRELNE